MIAVSFCLMVIYSVQSMGCDGRDQFPFAYRAAHWPAMGATHSRISYFQIHFLLMIFFKKKIVMIRICGTNCYGQNMVRHPKRVNFKIFFASRSQFHTLNTN